jgi:ABC-type nitrate/sulfonate/bicarbonate transport system substrate-binding protein
MKKVLVLVVLAILTLALPLYGAAAEAPRKVRIGYNGSACEAALFVAYHKGYFKELGIDADLVKMDFEALKEGLATGKVDATQGNFKWNGSSRSKRRISKRPSRNSSPSSPGNMPS